MRPLKFISRATLVFGILISIISISSGRAQAAPQYVTSIETTPSNFRQLCTAGTPVDFAVRPSNVNLNLDTGLLSYNIEIQWRRCTGQETRAYAVYSNGPEICPYSGIYGASGWVTDCVKYIGSPPYSEPGNSLQCWGGDNNQCVTSNFTGVRRAQNQPSSSIESISIPMSISNDLWAFAPDNGSWTVSQSMCQFYKTGLNFQASTTNRCVDVSITVQWSDEDPNSVTSIITPSSSTSLNDTESPSRVDFSTTANLTQGPGHSANITSQFYILRNGSNTPEYIPVSRFSPPFPPPTNPYATAVNLNAPTQNYRIEGGQFSALNLQVGDRICSRATINPSEVNIASNGSTTTVVGSVSSAPQCATLTNKPFISFYGGDVRVGSGFGDSCTLGTGTINTYNRGPSSSPAHQGSGAQLAVQALGNINGGPGRGFTSSSFNGGLPKGLSFANSNTAVYGGNFGSADCLPDYFSSTAGLTPSNDNTINLTNEAGGNYYRNTDVTLTGQLRPNQRYNIFVDGNLTIPSDIDYTTTNWGNYSNIPSLHVFVRGNILIEPGARVVTGMFVAQPDGSANSGRIDTCYNGTQGTNGTCNNQLVINGSLTANRVNYRRVANSLRDDQKPSIASQSRAAELFIFSPEQWIVRPGQIPGETGSQTNYDYFTVLPPIL